jgi:hypothetical protein
LVCISAAPPVADICDPHAAALTGNRLRDLLEDLRIRRYLGHALARGAQPPNRDHYYFT